MPPKTRARTTKASKENIGVVEKSKSKTAKATKPRKALADKTNSASDDNASAEIPQKVIKKTVSNGENALQNVPRPRRERRLPNRFVENQVLNNLSNSKEVETSKSAVNKSKTPNKNDSILSTSKTPQKDTDNSLLAPRPKRICRLPSKFDEHSVSPNKFIPVGCHASTPILPKKAKPDPKLSQKPASLKVVKEPKLLNYKSPPKTTVLNNKSPLKTSVSNNKNPLKTSVSNNKSPQKPSVAKASDSNNNAKQRLLNSRPTRNKRKSPEKSPAKTAGEKLLEKSFSFRVLEDKKKLKRDSSHLDVYEFTYDPNEEPPPQKKKRKKTVKKKPAKPKTVVFKNYYDQNVNKALAVLKNVVAKNTQQVAAKPSQTQTQNLHKPQVTVTDTDKQPQPQNVTENNHMSVGIEDIAADIEPLPDHHEINYSPVTSPNHGKSPVPLSITQDHSIDRPLANNDPLNLQEDFSFFDEPPVASSSMNMSVRRPHASPWRVQFEQLPIKWQVNTYVKANMTPAVESSFINFDDGKKKHVYTNMVPEANEELPEIVENNQPNLKQTSIISFIKDALERSASKKKRARSVTPTKANSLFEDISNISVHTNKDTAYRTPKKTPRREAPEFSTPQKSSEKNDSNSSKSSNGGDKENASEGKKKKSLTPGKSNKEKNKDGTFFGFDDSEDQENVSPVKIDNPRVRALRPRARAVLQEINAQTGPSRAKIPLAAKTKIASSSEAVNQVYEEMKSASDAPVFPEKNTEVVGATDVAEDLVEQEIDDDSQSVHLFEDIDIVHHLKPTRKSYGKAKKVTFRQTSTSDDTDVNDIRNEPDSGEEDDLADLTFTMPDMEQKKPKKKAKPKKRELSKKEKAELEAWAAGFNSMCEDIEEFPLLVE
ncbi:hypothetical protein ABMA28_007852 [Loxostege sticticalis]|uniref:Uncharacterized protein n=1 Tax=Loxostege sticticalis TaxID=481309 RepID=A0ABD0SN00_LOXSC